MEKKLFLFIMSILPITAWCDNEKGGVLIEQKDGSKVSYVFSQHPTINYRNEILVMTTDAVVVEYPLNELARLTFDETIVDAVEAPLTITSSMKGNEQRIYTLDGKLVCKEPSGKRLSTLALKSGVYVVKSENKSYKIIIK